MAKSRPQKGLERLAEAAGGPYRVEYAKPTKHAHWEYRATFYLRPGSTYDTVSEILDAWASDDTARRLIGGKSTARIQVAWHQGRGKSGEYTLAEIGTWDMTLDRALERVDVRDGDDDGLVYRYGVAGANGTSAIDRIYVWVGAKAKSVSGLDF